MAKPVANVATATDSFAGWITKTNVALDALANEIVTVDTSVSGANVSGNGSVIGQLSANTLGAIRLIGGGVGNTANISTLTIGFSNSTITSNVVIVGYTANVNSNTVNMNSNLAFTGANLSISTSNVNITGGAVNIVSNTSITGSTLSSTSNTSLSGANLHFSGVVTVANTIAVESNTYVNSAIIFNSNNTGIIQSAGDYAFPGDGTTSNVVDSFAISEYTSSKFTVNVKDNDNSNNTLISEISAVYGHGNVHSTEYGTIFSNTKFTTFTLEANTTHVKLLAVANSTVTNAHITVLRSSFK